MEDKAPSLDKAILLAYAKGVLPSILAHELNLSLHHIEEVIKKGKKEVERLTEIVGTAYQSVRMNNLFDVGLVKMEEVILEGAAEDKKFLDIMQELLKWRKSGDLEKIFDQRILNETYLDVPSSVGDLDEKIAQLEKDLKLR